MLSLFFTIFVHFNPEYKYMISPITGSSNIGIFHTYSTQEIIDLYQKQFGIDVSAYFDSSDLELYICKDTGLRFFYPAALAGNGNFYEQLQGSDNYYNPWRWDHEIASQYIPARSKVLEIGCGTGFFIDSLRKKNIQVTGLELNAKAVEEMKAKQLEAYNLTIENFSKQHQQEYDVVCAFQVLEHIADVRSFLSNSIDVLKKDGRLIIAVPYNHPYLYGHDIKHTLNLPPHHMGLWDQHSLTALTRYFPLSIEKIAIEPLIHYRHYLNIWFQHKLGKHIFSRALAAITTPFVKNILRLKLPGASVLVVFRKK